MNKLILSISVLIFLFSCSNKEKKNIEREKIKQNVEYSNFLNDTILLDFDVMKVKVIFESDSILKYDFPFQYSIGLVTWPSKLSNLLLLNRLLNLNTNSSR